jgi:predicted RNA-binding Zn-ribbon protein involved in translation (DUF1610 family)
MEPKTGTYTFNPPPNVPGGPIVVENSGWQECPACGETIISAQLSKRIEAVAKSRGWEPKYRRKVK